MYFTFPRILFCKIRGLLCGEGKKEVGSYFLALSVSQQVVSLMHI